MKRGSISRLAHALVEVFDIPVRVQRVAFVGELAILMYHGVVRHPLPVPDWCFVEEDQFAEEMHYLARRTRVLPLNTALQQMRDGTLDEPTVAITFDDGFQSVHDIAFTVLKELSLPSTVFLVTGFIDTSRTIWFCELIKMLSITDAQGMTWRGEQFDLRGRAAKAASSARLQSLLKNLHPDALQKELTRIQRILEVADETMEAVHAPFQMLDRKSIATLGESGLVEFGAHTESHTILTRVDHGRAAMEIENSVRSVSELAGAPCHLFAYPNGRREDYDRATIAALSRTGISSAVTTVLGPNTRGTPELELRRYGVGAGITLTRFKIEVHHIRAHIARAE